jgi:hypothetical protein
MGTRDKYKGIHQHPAHITERAAQSINTVKPQQKDRTKHNVKLIIIIIIIIIIFVK